MSEPMWSRSIMSKIMPFAAVGFIVGGLVSMGMPGFSGFVAEFPIFMGVWGAQWLVAVVASISIVITAAYIMRNIRQVFFAKMPEKLEGHMTDVTVLDKVAITTLCLFMIILGLFPSFMVPLVSTGVENILRLLGGSFSLDSAPGRGTRIDAWLPLVEEKAL